MKINYDRAIDFDDVLIVPKDSIMNSRKDVKVAVNITNGISGFFIHDAIPIIVANMDSTGTPEMAKSICNLNAFVALSKHYGVVDVLHSLSNRTFVTIGTTDSDLARFKNLTREIGEIRLICIDAANGYTKHFQDVVKYIRGEQRKAKIMAGNVATKEGALNLLAAGADIIKVGLGSSIVCTTRYKTGVGVPQLQAILDCADAVHESGGLICSDGGIKNPADVCKAFCAGADFVMSGYLFAGTDECNNKYRSYPTYEYHGMASAEAQNENSNGVKDYATEEGKSVSISVRGPAENALKDILGGIRSCCTYIGASSIVDMRNRAELRLVTRIH